MKIMCKYDRVMYSVFLHIFYPTLEFADRPYDEDVWRDRARGATVSNSTGIISCALTNNFSKPCLRDRRRRCRAPKIVLKN